MKKIYEFSNIAEIDIHVDSRIRNITDKLLHKEHTKAEVSNFWRDFCKENDLIPIRIDKSLLLNDKYNDEWG